MPRTIIEPPSGWKLVDLDELWRYRDLLYFLVRRTLLQVYQQTVMGFGWAIIRPVFSMVVFSVVFGRLARMPSDGIPYPLFSYAALVPWTYFATALTQSTNSLVADRNLLTKVYFPRVIIPLTPVLAGLVDFAIAFMVLLLMMLGYGVAPTWNVLALPLLVAMMVLMATGCGLWLTAMAIRYRDIPFAMQFLVQLLMYAAPVVWPASLIPSQWRLLYGLYPMVGVIEGFRAALLGSRAMPWDLIGMGLLSSSIVFMAGLFYFRRMEAYFADVA